MFAAAKLMTLAILMLLPICFLMFFFQKSLKLPE